RIAILKYPEKDISSYLAISQDANFLFTLTH
ncbi:hypothetical protein EZS27_014092, partial [termite gut metagenome]